MVDAQENHIVKVVDVPGEFIQVDQDDEVHVQFTREMVKKLLEINEEMYQSYVQWERNQKVMYVKLLRELYGMVRAAKLSWQCQTKHLVEDWGFTINPYNPCVVNKIIDGKHYTMVWHVDGQKQVVVGLIGKLNPEFGECSPLMVSSGDQHDYHGMTLDFSHKGSL